ncbi:N-acetylglucosamine kinase [Salinactinospora qingdaonensis]|uniref:BadF/BadG/BcrA/BcrD ATPase family protein n=1 Tax=Salinactinospora qingdaonensis TaxID=702744 RepID=A0ABP7EWR8_9ACTN
MRQSVVIGVDAGGTATRCVVATLDGRVVARGEAGGANQYSSAAPATALREALLPALEAAGDVTVAAAVCGIAGAAGAGHARVQAWVLDSWHRCGLLGAPHVCDDIAVAFAAGSAEREGVVVIAGTGAVAAHVCEGAVVRRCDGYGWLLGDEGSSVWLAVRALRAVLAELDGRGPATSLTSRLPPALGAAPGDPRSIVTAVYDRPPAELGLLAPEVTGAAAAGDAVANTLVAEATRRLLSAAATVIPQAVTRGEREPIPVVLAGSVLAGGLVAEAVTARLWQFHGVRPVRAVDGACGAAGLALHRIGSTEAHARLLAVAPTQSG